MAPGISFDGQLIEDLDSVLLTPNGTTIIHLAPARNMLGRVNMSLSDQSADTLNTSCDFNSQCFWRPQLLANHNYTLVYNIHYQTQCRIVKGQVRVHTIQAAASDGYTDQSQR
jgi:hypothetical protein